MFQVQFHPRSLPFTSLTATFAFIALTVGSGSKLLAQTPAPATEATPQPSCISGYPDGTFQGDRPITRYEFAAGVNACLDTVNQQIGINRANLATKADFQALIQRQRELNAELRALSDRVDQMLPETDQEQE